jgi:fermentation-respiration switch protein FrsA (DUF1100 family)
MSKKWAALGADRGATSSGNGVSAPSRSFRPLLAATAAIALVLWPCPFATLLGIPCPGCGLTRAAWALLQGEWRRALALHPLSPLLVPVVAGLGLVLMAGEVRGAPATALVRWQVGLLWALCAGLLGVWLSRFAGAFGGPVPVQSLLGVLRSVALP